PNGPAHGRNEGARAVTAEILVFVDADVVLETDAIARLEEALLGDASVSAVFGSYNRAPRAKRLSGLYANLRHHYIHQNGDREAATFWTGIGAVRAAAFFAAGGFDERFSTSMEDIELGARLIAAGGRIRIVPEAQGAHCKDMTLLGLWKSDIFNRAIPWAGLIAAGGGAYGHLNASAHERLSALSAHFVLLLTIAAFFDARLAIAALAALFAYVLFNRRLIALLFEVGGVKLAVVGAGLHWLYHLYASVIFAAVALAVRLKFFRPARLPALTPDNASWAKASEISGESC
ncbi:MAG: glycosyltransferase family 2 protein, partial [Parvularculaceae bacterium]